MTRACKPLVCLEAHLYYHCICHRVSRALLHDCLQLARQNVAVARLQHVLVTPFAGSHKVASLSKKHFANPDVSFGNAKIAPRSLFRCGFRLSQ
jgi:hypothetical protein